MGNQEGDQVGNSQAYPRIATNKKPPTRNAHTTKPRGDIPTRKQWQSELWRPDGTRHYQETTKVQYIESRIPKKDPRTTMPQMRKTWTLSQRLLKTGWTQTIERTSQKLATRKENRPLANQTEDQGNGG